MDTIENLIIAIVKPLISQPDALTIKIEDTPEFWSITWILTKAMSVVFSVVGVALLKGRKRRGQRF